MKLLDKTLGQFLNVYGIYWHGGKTYFYCFPNNGVGISSYGEEEVEVVDSKISVGFEYKITGHGIPGIFHRQLLAENLLDALLEHDPEAYRKFILLIGGAP
ncbi:hypothetical protein [Methylobacillus flagellatus]|uniref:hypothetical protein n=1 Tax=Methylobacillus flagellatus TaxID=405 RepID=UPI0010F4C977|nr:hypothetical protein [Methylobacillus flagellatus]